jgi:hypothetical protein
MRATVMYGAGDVCVEDVPDARLIESTDVLVRITRACICGSDLWPYQSMAPSAIGNRMGHEFIGVVEDVGADVRTIRRGDVVVAPFAISDGSCDFCLEGLHTSCVHGGWWGGTEHDGGQGEAVRVPLADGTLVPLPVGEDHQLMPSLLTLSDVMGTGHHAALAARVRPGNTHSVLECVGHGQATLTSLGVARAGGAVGRVGVPQLETIPAATSTFFANITIAGGPAPVRAYIDELLPDVLEGRIQPGRVFDRVTNLDGVPAGYRAMNERNAIKVMIAP